MSRRVLPAGLLLLLLAGLVPLKRSLDYGLGEWANDGSYYFTIARSVAAGEGFQSNLSLYYQGFKQLPHHVTASPVWPATLGAFGALFGIERVTYALPVSLYFLDLVLIYLLALRIQRGVVAPGGVSTRGWPLNLGHFAAFVFGTNAVFFQFSSVPNNEPLAFALVFGALLAVDRAARETAGRWAFAAGLLAGLAMLTRIQALAVLPAVLLCLAAHAVAESRARRLAPLALLGAALPFVPWLLYLASWMDPVTFSAVLGQDTQRETPELEPFAHAFVPGSWSAFLLDRLAGVAVAFDWRSPESYVSHFGPLAYAVPLALAHFAWRLARGRSVAWLALSRERVLPAATLLAGVGMLLPVHAAHMTFVYDWLFGFRHGLPLILLIVLALPYLFAYAGRAGRGLAALLAAATLVTNVLGMQALFARELRHGLKDGERQFVEWMEAQRPMPSAVTTEPWMYGAFSTAGFHWILCRHSPEQTLRLLRNAGADYVVLRRTERDCEFVRGLEPDRLRRVLTFRNGIRVYALPERLGHGVRRMLAPGAAERP